MSYVQAKQLDKYLTRDLLLLNEKGCKQAIELLTRRLEDFKNEDFYLSISITDLPFGGRGTNLMTQNGLKTVKDILEYGVDNLLNIRGFGYDTLGKIRQVLQKLIERKDKVIGLSKYKIWAVLRDEFLFDDTNKLEG